MQEADFIDEAKTMMYLSCILFFLQYSSIPSNTAHRHMFTVKVCDMYINNNNCLWPFVWDYPGEPVQGIYCNKWISATFLFYLPLSRSCSQHVTLESY